MSAKKERAVTIRDVAGRAGCSVSSVSLVLNGKDEGLSPALRARVLEAAKSLKYRPNQLAVSLVKRRSKSIGLVVPDISNLFFAKLVRVVGERCRERGFNIILSDSADDARRELRNVEVLLDLDVDGVLLCSAARTGLDEAARILAALERRGLPYCVVDRYFRDLPAHVCSVDHYETGRIATRALLEAGHRRIACLSGPSHLEVTQSRLQGYRDALADFGLAFEPGLVFPGDFGWEAALGQVEALIRSGATGLFASNDLSALGVLRGLYDRGLRVPDDLSLVGVDDSDFALLAAVPLTSVRQPVEELGRLAVDRVLKQVEGESLRAETLLVKPELVSRDSVRTLRKQRRNHS